MLVPLPPKTTQQKEISATDPSAVKQRMSVELRSEEHTSELQSQSNLVCRLLLEKKNRPRPVLCSGILNATGDLQIADVAPACAGAARPFVAAATASAAVIVPQESRHCPLPLGP